MKIRYLLSVAILVAVHLGWEARLADASLVHWTVQSASSNLTVTGTAALGTLALPLSPQAPGSNTTAIAGEFDTSLNLGSSIDFIPANLSLLNNGNWSPLAGGTLGTAPANLGLQASFTKVAGRDMTFAIDTPALVLSGGPALSTFSMAGTTTFTGANIDYNTLGGAARSSDMVGGNGPLTGTAATLSIIGSAATLTIPYAANNVSVLIDDKNTPDPSDDLTGVLNLSGTIVATATVSEPSSIALAAVAMLGLVRIARHSRRVTRNETLPARDTAG